MMLAAPSRVLLLVLVAACALGAASQAPRVAGKPRPATNVTTADVTSPNEGKRWGSLWSGFKQYYAQKDRVCVGAAIDASTGRAPVALPHPARCSPRLLKLCRFVRASFTLSIPRPSTRHSSTLRCIARPPSSLPSPSYPVNPRPSAPPRSRLRLLARALSPCYLSPSLAPFALFLSSLVLSIHLLTQPALSLYQSLSSCLPPCICLVPSHVYDHASLCQSMSHNSRL